MRASARAYYKVLRSPFRFLERVASFFYWPSLDTNRYGLSLEFPALARPLRVFNLLTRFTEDISGVSKAAHGVKAFYAAIIY